MCSGCCCRARRGRRSSSTDLRVYGHAHVEIQMLRAAALGVVKMAAAAVLNKMERDAKTKLSLAGV